jgi:PAS domain S-box-containing protein
MGTTLWMIYNVFQVLDEQGRVSGYATVSRDITEWKRGEEALRRSRDRFELLSRTVSRLLTSPEPQQVIEELCNQVRLFLDCAVFFNFLVDPQTKRLRLNACGGVDRRLARKVESLELSESLCGSAAQGSCRVLAENLSTTADPRAALVKSLGIRAYACHPLLRADGEAFGTLSFGTRNRDEFDPQDLELMQAVADHVAVALLREQAKEALRESERLYRAIGESIDYGIWVCDAQGRNIYASDSFLSLTGITQEQCSEFGWGDVLHPEDVEATLAAWKQCVQSGGPWYREHRYRGADGQWHPILACGVAVRNQRGEITHWAGINLDISRLKQTEADLRKTKDELAATNANLERMVAERTAALRELVAELEHFSYSITHDMRAPLRAMMGFAEVVKDMCPKPEQTQQKIFLERIQMAARRMDLLITDALNYSRAVRSALPLAPTDLGRLLQGMVDTYPELQGTRGSIRIDPELPLVMGNEAGLTQCFSNLLVNAVKFTRPGEAPQVRVWAQEGNSEAGCVPSGWVRIWVEDKGIGIGPKLLPRLFGMFSRGANPQAGTGIGLALVRKVVERMDGRVGVESEEGRGSRFWVELRSGNLRTRVLEG